MQRLQARFHPCSLVRAHELVVGRVNKAIGQGRQAVRAHILLRVPHARAVAPQHKLLSKQRHLQFMCSGSCAQGLEIVLGAAALGHTRASECERHAHAHARARTCAHNHTATRQVHLVWLVGIEMLLSGRRIPGLPPVKTTLSTACRGVCSDRGSCHCTRGGGKAPSCRERRCRRHILSRRPEQRTGCPAGGQRSTSRTQP